MDVIFFIWYFLSTFKVFKGPFAVELLMRSLSGESKEGYGGLVLCVWSGPLGKIEIEQALSVMKIQKGWWEHLFKYLVFLVCNFHGFECWILVRPYWQVGVRLCLFPLFEVLCILPVHLYCTAFLLGTFCKSYFICLSIKILERGKASPDGRALYQLLVENRSGDWVRATGKLSSCMKKLYKLSCFWFPRFM